MNMSRAKRGYSYSPVRIFSFLYRTGKLEMEIFMAGTCVHLAVAAELNQIFQKQRRRCLGAHAEEYDSSLFFAGNICPDGIMARKNYRREMKLHSHLRDGIPDGTFQEPEKLALFHQRLKSFYQSNLEREDRDFSLYLGYLTHMLTDEKFILEIHSGVLDAIARTGYTSKNKETFVLFGQDVDQIDFRLAAEYPGIREVYEALRTVSPYEVAGMITTEELTDSRNWILRYFFETPHEIRKPRFLPYDRMLRFIPDAVEEIMHKLPEYVSD